MKMNEEEDEVGRDTLIENGDYTVVNRIVNPYRRTFLLLNSISHSRGRNPNIAKRYPYLTDGLKEWGQYEIDWPEYDVQNQTYLNLSKPEALARSM